MGGRIYHILPFMMEIKGWYEHNKKIMNLFENIHIMFKFQENVTYQKLTQELS